MIINLTFEQRKALAESLFWNFPPAECLQGTPYVKLVMPGIFASDRDRMKSDYDSLLDHGYRLEVDGTIVESKKLISALSFPSRSVFTPDQESRIKDLILNALSQMGFGR